jgi:hypothetical protein
MLDAVDTEVRSMTTKQALTIAVYAVEVQVGDLSEALSLIAEDAHAARVEYDQTENRMRKRFCRAIIERQLDYQQQYQELNEVVAVLMGMINGTRAL